MRDSATAVEKLALAERMERLKEWDKSADVYQEVADKFADRIVPSQLDRNMTIYQYTSVVTTVQRRLAKWPAEGLNAYLHKFEPTAASMLEAAAPDDLAALNRVVSQYFITDAGKTAALRLIDLNLESGDFAAAAWLGEQLLEIHPNLQAERAKLTYRTSLAHHLAGDDKAAQARLADLKQKDPSAAGIIRGVDTKLTESLEVELKIAPPTARDASADSWPMLGGAPDRARVPDAKGRPGAKLFEVPIAKGSHPFITDATMRPNFVTQTGNARENGLMLGIMPVVDGGELFFQDNARIYAVRLESNVPLPGWLATYGSERQGQYVTDNATSRPRSVQLNVHLTDNSVLAILGQLDRLAAQNGANVQNRESKIVCLDRETGREKWVAKAKQLPDNVANLRDIEFGGAPLVVGDNVYVAARGGKPMQFEDAYVLCYGLADGKFRWACYVASGSVPGEIFDGTVAMSENISQLAYASGRLYVLTNLGAAAAIDAYRGTIVWLNIYPRPERNMRRQRFDMPMLTGPGQKPWAFNAPIVKDGKVFVLPSDAENLLIYDAGSGVELKRIRLADFDDADTIIGIAGERLVLSSDNKLWCINWPQYEAKKASEGNLFWYSSQPPPKPDASNPSGRGIAIRGRGFLTSDSVLLPVKWGIVRVDLATGRVVERYPSSGEWNNREEEPGNILVTQDHLIVAGMDRIAVYTDMDLAKSKLDREVAAAPSSPEPRLRYAEMMFVSGQYDLALGKLDEAIGLVGGIGSMKRGPDRDRIFGDALAFAQKLADPQNESPEIIQRADVMFQRAAAAADSPAQQVQYRLAHRKFAQTMRDFPVEVRLCQEILADPAMRNVAVMSGPSSGAPMLASAFAENRINELNKDFPGIYKEFDQRAAAELEKARDKKDADAFVAVAQVYPNSSVAAEAMLAAADIYEGAGNQRAATQVLNQAYRRFTDRSEEDKARVIEAQARNYLALPNGVGIAMGRFEEGAKLKSNPSLQRPLKLPDGSMLEKVSFADARTALQKYNSAMATRALPDLKIPVPEEHAAAKSPFAPENGGDVIENVDDLLIPLREFSRNDRLLTWSSDKGVAIYAVGTTTPMGASNALAEPPLRCAWLGDRLLVTSATKIALLQGDNANVVWQVSLKDLPRAELVPADEDEAAPQEVAAQRPGVPAQVLQLNRQMLARRRGLRNFPNPPVVNPDPPQRNANAPEAIEHVCPAGDRIIIATSNGRVFGLETANGKPAWQTRLIAGAIDQVLANDDFVGTRFVDEQGSQIVALDSFAGQIVYRRAFTGADGLLPQNMALAPSGQLVYTLNDRLCIKDLFEGSSDIVEWPADGSQIYTGATGSDQLVVADGRVVALGDNATMVRVHSLQTAKLLNPPLQTEVSANNWAVSLRVVGPHLYTVNSKTAVANNLDLLEDHWSGTPMRDKTPAIRDFVVGTKFLVLLDQPTAPPGPPSPASPYRLQMINLTLTSKGVQTGRIEYFPMIKHPAGITRWQAVDGGFYYRSGDGELHFLRGREGAG